MTKKKEEVPGPTKAKIEYLLRHGCFMGGRYEDSEDPDYKKYKELEEEYRRRLKEFEDTKEMKRLDDHKEMHHGLWMARRKAFEERLTKIRREFYARGMTPKVLKALGDYVDDLNGTK